MVKTRAIRLRGVEGRNELIKLRFVHFIHSYWKSKRMLATYMQRMRNNNLEIRIASSSCRPQLTPRPSRLRHTRRQVAPIRLCKKPLGVHRSDSKSWWNDAEQVAVTFRFVWHGEFLCVNLRSAVEFVRLVARKKFCPITGKKTQISIQNFNRILKPHTS